MSAHNVYFYGEIRKIAIYQYNMADKNIMSRTVSEMYRFHTDLLS